MEATDDAAGTDPARIDAGTDAVSRDHLSRAEIGKDTVQATAEAAATTVGEVATIITTAVKDIAGAIGGFATEVFEIRDSARKATEEHGVVDDDVV